MDAFDPVVKGKWCEGGCLRVSTYHRVTVLARLRRRNGTGVHGLTRIALKCLSRI